jgi:hypothetical protein
VTRHAPLHSIVLAASFVAVLGGTALAQDLEPRAYSASPVGTTFAVVGLGRSSGDVIFDPSVPISDVNAEIQAATLGLGRTFSLGGRLGQVAAVLPYSWGTVEGRVFEEARRVHRSGLADVRMRMAVNLRGAPAMTPREFAARGRRTTLVGASLALIAPTGQYDPSKLINLGSNRWAFKPEIGISHPFRHWDLDVYGGVWFFTDNADYFPGASTRDQDPIGVVQAHASYTFKQRGWVAADMTWYGGGAASVDQAPPIGRQNNARYGATLAWPIGRRQSIKASYAAGAVVRSGSNFRTFAVAWQVLWFDRQKAAR